MLDARIASALNKIIPNSQFKKKVSLEEQKAQKEDRFRRGRQIAYLVYDYFRVTGAHDTVLDYADLFSATLPVDNVQEFDTRCDEVLLIVYVKDSIQWCLGKFVHIKNTCVCTTQNRIGIVWHGDSSNVIDAQLSKIEDDGEKEKKIRNFDCETLTPGTGELKQEQWSRIERDLVALKEEKVHATCGKKKANVRRETSAVSGMRVTIVHKHRHRKPPHLLSHQWHEVEVCRGKSN